MVGPPMIAARENLSEEGARALANRIEEYWRGRGVAVRARVEKVATRCKDGGQAYGVRSDLRLGCRRSESL
jgi:hypothetical protein